MRWELFDFLGCREEQTGFFCLFLPPCHCQRSDSTLCSSKIFLKVSLLILLILTSVDSPLLLLPLLKYVDFIKQNNSPLQDSTTLLFFSHLFFIYSVSGFYTVNWGTVLLAHRRTNASLHLFQALALDDTLLFRTQECISNTKQSKFPVLGSSV